MGVAESGRFTGLIAGIETSTEKTRPTSETCCKVTAAPMRMLKRSIRDAKKWPKVETLTPAIWSEADSSMFYMLQPLHVDLEGDECLQREESFLWQQTDEKTPALPASSAVTVRQVSGPPFFIRDLHTLTNE